MRRNPYNRLSCLICVITMLFLGMRVETFDMDSSFRYGNCSSYAMGIQRIDSERSNSVYCQRKVPGQSEEFHFIRRVVRSSDGIRLSQWLLFVIFNSGVFQLTAYYEISFLLSGACRNQCGLRILEYIHHKDGKKA